MFLTFPKKVSLIEKGNKSKSYWNLSVAMWCKSLKLECLVIESFFRIPVALHHVKQFVISGVNPHVPSL